MNNSKLVSQSLGLHTPGPWTIDNNGKHNFVIVGQRYIGEVYNHSSQNTVHPQYADIEKQLANEALANARLIAKAPLLTECEKVLRETLDALFNETHGKQDSPWILGVKTRAADMLRKLEDI